MGRCGCMFRVRSISIKISSLIQAGAREEDFKEVTKRRPGGSEDYSQTRKEGLVRNSNVLPKIGGANAHPLAVVTSIVWISLHLERHPQVLSRDRDQKNRKGSNKYKGTS